MTLEHNKDKPDLDATEAALNSATDEVGLDNKSMVNATISALVSELDKTHISLRSHSEE